MKRGAFTYRSRGGVLLIESAHVTTGQRFFVHSGTGTDATGYGTSPDSPFATLDYAIGQCTASKGDVIYVMPGHAENVASAGAITADVAGISIIGLGNGANRPTFTFSNTAGTIAVSAANVTFSNIRCTVSVDSVVKGFNITAANCTLDKVDYVEATAMQMLIFVQTSAAADGLTIKNCHHVQVTAGAAKWIDLIGCDNAVIKDNFFHVNASTHIVGGTTTASINVNIVGNLFVNAADAASVVLLAASTGIVAFNGGAGAKTALAGMFDLASAYGVENYSVNTVNKSGILDPVADT